MDSFTFAPLNYLMFLSLISLPLILHLLTSALANKYYLFSPIQLNSSYLALGNNLYNILFKKSVIMIFYFEEIEGSSDIGRWLAGWLGLFLHNFGKCLIKAPHVLNQPLLEPNISCMWLGLWWLWLKNRIFFLIKDSAYIENMSKLTH